MIITIKKLFWKIKHSMFGCPDKDLHYVNDSYAICSKCDKKHFVFKCY